MRGAKEIVVVLPHTRRVPLQLVTATRAERKLSLSPEAAQHRLQDQGYTLSTLECYSFFFVYYDTPLKARARITDQACTLLITGI